MNAILEPSPLHSKRKHLPETSPDAWRDAAGRRSRRRRRHSARNPDSPSSQPRSETRANDPSEPWKAWAQAVILNHELLKVVEHTWQQIKRTWSIVQKIWASSCWKRRTLVSPVSVPESSLRCSTPKSASLRGSSRQERGRWPNIRLTDGRQTGD